MLTIYHYLGLSTALFAIGAMGLMVHRRNIIVLLMAIELLLLAVNINLVGFSALHQNLDGKVFSLFILTVAAAEAAIGLAILVLWFRAKGALDSTQATALQG
jgi:NADH-quinone oxidoreductase subunit K